MPKQWFQSTQEKVFYIGVEISPMTNTLKEGKIEIIRPLLLLTTFKVVKSKSGLIFFNFPLLSRFSDV